MSIASTPAARALPPSALGWTAMCAALVTWAGFSLSMRGIGASDLTPSDVALLRFGVPALLLLPLVPARLGQLKRVRAAPALMVAVGAGLPFFALVAAGGRFTSAAHVSALVAGTAPLAVAILGRILTGQGGSNRPGLATIILGIALLVAGLGGLDGRVLAGVALLLGASLLWGTYTIGMRLAAVTPMTCLMLVTYPSAFAILALKAGGVLETHLGAVDGHEILVFAGVQGIGTGIVSTLAYAIAVRHLGAIRCSTMGALAPVLATGAAIPVLGELPTALTLMGVATVAIGVTLANARRAAAPRLAVAR